MPAPRVRQGHPLPLHRCRTSLATCRSISATKRPFAVIPLNADSLGRSIMVAILAADQATRSKPRAHRFCASIPTAPAPTPRLLLAGHLRRRVFTQSRERPPSGAEGSSPHVIHRLPDPRCGGPSRGQSALSASEENDAALRASARKRTGAFLKKWLGVGIAAMPASPNGMRRWGPSFVTRAYFGRCPRPIFHGSP
jgi:hypothetical protein